MRIEKEVLENTIKKLTRKAQDCFTRAEAQHTIADTQADIADAEHASAEKLESLGHSLIEDAIQLKGEIDHDDVKYRGSFAVEEKWSDAHVPSAI